MSVELRQLRCLLAVVDCGTFTDAAIDLGVSQAAVSRTLASLEADLGVRLLRRTTRSLTPTPAGTRVIARARRLLAEADDLVRDATTGHTDLRLGHAWSALGRHTTAFQRRWATAHPQVSLHLVRTNSATAGLAEGACDIAVTRTRPDPARFAAAIVGLERRFVALAADDPWARRRSLTMAEIGTRTLLVDRRAGTTTVELWPAGSRPVTEDVRDVDDWLAAIGAGRVVGITAEATAAQYRRPEIVYRPIRDVAPLPVHLVWWRDDPHPSVTDAVALATELYRRS
ncbi:LysR family transcriptional regulator [Jatrophihabitans sp. YIM 134969]